MEMNKATQNIEIRFKNGESIGLNDFFFSYYSELSTFASKYVLDIPVCEDIVQEVFIMLWQRNDHFQDITAAKSFVYTSVRNSCLNYLKHVKVKEKYLEYKLNIAEDSESFFEEIIKVEAYSQIRKEIDKLPSMERKILLMAMSDKSNEEIAGLLSISINTVRTHKARAYKVLRTNLKDVFLIYLLTSRLKHSSKKV